MMQKYTIFIGLDMSKEWLDACLYWEGQKVTSPQARFDNHGDGFQQLLDWVTQQVKRHGRQGKWYFCMEHTGLYSLPLALFLQERSATFVLESPLRINRSMGLKREKSDPLDAADIAYYAARHYRQIKTRPLPSGVLLQVQHLLRQRARLVRYRQGLQVAAGEIKAMAPARISEQIEQFNQPVCQQINTQIKGLDQLIQELLGSDEQLKRLYNLVRSVVGIGPVCAAYLLVYTSGFTAFDKARQFACYVGIAPFGYRSGKSIEQPSKVSYLANRRIKALLSMAAISARTHDPHFRTFFNRRLKEGKKEGWIYNAIKNKLIYRVFAVVKRGTPYVPLEQHRA